MGKVVWIALVAIACEAGSKPDPQEPRSEATRAAQPPAPTKPAPPEQVALETAKRSSDPCEGGESQDSGGLRVGGGGGPMTGKGGGGLGSIGAGAPAGGAAHGSPDKPPRAAFGTAVIKGDFDKAVVRRYLQRNLRRIVACYKRQLASDPSLAGALTVEFSINERGELDQVAVTKGLQADVDACVAGVIRSIEFPKPANGAVGVTQQITFAPS